MAPNVANTKLQNKQKKISSLEMKNFKKDLIKLRKFVEKNFEYVGDNFPREVRKVYYDKRKNRNIYGNATPEETEDLKEEGIEVTTVPWSDKKEN